MPRRPDERAAGLVLLLPRPFADEHQRRMQVALAEHNVRSRLAEPAFFAGKHGFRERWPRCVHAAASRRLIFILRSKYILSTLLTKKTEQFRNRKTFFILICSLFNVDNADKAIVIL